MQTAQEVVRGVSCFLADVTEKMADQLENSCSEQELNEFIATISYDIRQYLLEFIRKHNPKLMLKDEESA